MRLAEERRDDGHDEQRDQPRIERQQAGQQRRDGDGVLHLPHQLGEQDGAAGGLLPCPLQGVVKGGVFELVEVEGRRVAHDAQGGGVGELVAQQPIYQVDGAAQRVGRDGDAGLQGHEGPEVALVAPRVAADRHHLVDDELADVEQPDRGGGPQEAQGEAEARLWGAGLPDEPEEGRQVAQRCHALAEGDVGKRLVSSGRAGHAASRVTDLVPVTARPSSA